MNPSTLGLWVLMAVQSTGAPQGPAEPFAETAATTQAQQEVISLSQEKWRWRSERNVEACVPERLGRGAGSCLWL